MDQHRRAVKDYERRTFGRVLDPDDDGDDGDNGTGQNDDGANDGTGNAASGREAPGPSGGTERDGSGGGQFDEKKVVRMLLMDLEHRDHDVKLLKRQLADANKQLQ